MATSSVPELTTDALWDLIATRGEGVLATIRKDSRPQLSNIAYRWNPAAHTASFVAASFRAKTRNLARDPRASLHVTGADFKLWVVADGEVTLSASCEDHGDAVGQRLIELFGLADGRTAQKLADHLEQYPIVGRHLIELKVSRIYGGNATKALAIAAEVSEGADAAAA